MSHSRSAFGYRHSQRSAQQRHGADHVAATRSASRKLPASHRILVPSFIAGRQGGGTQLGHAKVWLRSLVSGAIRPASLVPQHEAQNTASLRFTMQYNSSKSYRVGNMSSRFLCILLTGTRPNSWLVCYTRVVLHIMSMRTLFALSEMQVVISIAAQTFKSGLHGEREEHYPFGKNAT